jgi:hypothetical protein
MFWLSRITEHSTHAGGMLGPVLVLRAGLGLVFVPISLVILNKVTTGNTGVASSLNNVGQQVGGSIGLAILGTVAWSAVASSLRSQAAAAAKAGVHPSARPGSRAADPDLPPRAGHRVLPGLPGLGRHPGAGRDHRAGRDPGHAPGHGRRGPHASTSRSGHLTKPGLRPGRRPRRALMTWVPMPRKAMTTASSRQSAGYASAIVIAGPAGASAGGRASYPARNLQLVRCIRTSVTVPHQDIGDSYASRLW